ncbi:hypothetical protein [Clostridium felsineum]|uniref:hypothetical protein n=1 Tax=Clostridium felsineum TaxID=36839 RepID=UPI00098C5DB1|nr:hypothetical protein [Clostridium felsineum]URZ16932.1 hypothetical protein CLFE_029790 [Clostridium felsineum DSM 794]
MDDLEKWVKDYSEKNGLKYQETIFKALKFYKKFVEEGKSEYYDLGKKLNEFIKENQNTLFKKETSTISIERNKEKGLLQTEVLEDVDKKERYLKSIDNISSNLINIILSENTVILKIYDSDKVVASGVISFENLAESGAKYVFVHYIRISSGDYRKIYPMIEKKIESVAEKFGAHRIDRVISSEAINSFKNLGYNEVYKNYYLRIKTDKRNYNLGEYEKVSRHSVGSKYVPIFKMCPDRFQIQNAMNRLYRFTTEKGRFYAQISIKDSNASAKLYFDRSKLGKVEYTKSVYYTLIKYFNKANVKNLYTLMDQRHINVVGSIDSARKIKEWVWIRKLL